MKKLVCLILLLTLIVPGAGLASAQDDPVTLRYTFWIALDHPAVIDAFQPLAEAYMAENPNVTIEYSFIPFAEYNTTIGTQLSGNEPPDAGWIVERSGPAFQDAGILYDLGPTLREDEAYDFADFSEPALGLWTEDEVVYGIPFSTSPFITTFNATLFEQAGIETPAELAAKGEWTWEALREAARAIKEETGAWGFVSVDAALYTSTGNAWATIIAPLRAYGTDVFDAENNCTMDSEAAVESLGLLHQMIFEDQSMVPPGTEVVFESGNVGMTIGQVSRLTNLDDATFEWGITTMPGGPAGDAHIIGQAAMVVFDGANNTKQEAAADFVKYLTSEEGVATLAPFFPPARLSVLGSEEFLTGNSRVSPDDMENVVAAATAGGRVLSGHKNWSEIELIGATALDMLWMPDADVPATLSMFCDLVEPYLE